MATFVIDNSGTIGIQDVHYDQSPGAETPSTTDTGDDISAAITSLNDLDSGFASFLAGLSPALTSTQTDYAVLADGAASSSTFITATADPGETLNDLKLLADSSTALTGVTTLDDEAIYVHVDASGNYATLETAGGRVVGAIGLVDETIDNTTTHTATAGVQMVFFEAINHTDSGDYDESVPLGDVLKVAVDSAVSFDFHQLQSGNFLWAAVGDGSSAMLITGQDLNVNDTGSSKQGTITKGGSDPSDAVNTSQATETTIGINAQHFAPTTSGNGATGVFTFVTGYAPLELSTPVYTGQNVKQIDYDDFINVNSASVFISQLTGGSSAKIHFSFWEAGGGEGTANVDGTDHETGDLVPEEGYSGANSYIGDQNLDTHLKDDTAVNIASVTIDGFTWAAGQPSNGTLQGGITVTITGNDVTVLGAQANDLITFTAVDTSAVEDGTFNRIDIQALQGSASFDIGHIDLSSGGLTPADLGSHLFVDDDGPKIDPSDDSSAPNDLKVDNDLSDAADSTDSSFFILDPGTDGQGGFTIVASDGTYTEDQTGAFRWTYDDTNHDAITGTYRGADNVDHDLYTLVLNSDGTYSFTITGSIPGSQTDFSSTGIHAGGPANSIDVPTTDGTGDFAEIIGIGGQINASNGFVGVGSANLDTGEGLTLSLHESDGDIIGFTSISIGSKSAQSATYDWSAIPLGGGTAIEGSITVPKNTALDITSAMLGGVMVESITIEKTGGNALKIGVGDIHIFTLPPDAQLEFYVALSDGDGDAATSNFFVDIDGDNNNTWDATVNSAAVPADNSTLSAIETLHHHEIAAPHDALALQ